MDKSGYINFKHLTLDERVSDVMKRFLSVVLCMIMLLSVIVVPAFASETSENLVSREVECFEDGLYLVTEVYEKMIQRQHGRQCKVSKA